MMKRKQPLDDTINNVAKMSKLEDDPAVSVSEKQKKYDRQLRLWGDQGQNDLEKASVCLINANAVGTETLKCLVLPGIGAFTIIDNNKVSKEDISNNFFVDAKSLGKPRAKVACQLLKELNEDVKGEYHSLDPTELIQEKVAMFEKFTVVIASGLPESALLKLSSFLWERNISLVLCESVAFFGYARIVLQEHTVIESHPDNALHDLRLDQPFEELKAFMNSMDLDAMTNQEHSHTPYLVIIFKALQQWTNENCKWPSTYKEKKEIKELISKGKRKRDEEFDEDEENFDEAVNNVNNTLVQTKVPSDVRDILSCSASLEHTKSKNFWILTKAVAEFVKRHECLPLRGSIPDMFSDSKRFIKLQNIYREKALSDADEVFGIVKDILKQEHMELDISQEEVRHFCKHSHQLYVTRGRPLSDEFNSNKVKGKLIQYIENEDECGDFKLYTIFRSLSKYLDKNSRCTGQSEEGSGIDSDQFKAVVQDVCADLGTSAASTFTHVEELSRCNFSELHSVSAALGGMVSHEVIKLLTKQFVPVNNCILYNAISQSTLTLVLP